MSRKNDAKILVDHFESLHSDYERLEQLQDEFHQKEKEYYQLRYKYWSALCSIKKHSPMTIPYKKFEARVRNDCKRRKRQNHYGKRPRGKQLDHKTPVLYYYCIGEEDLDVINSLENCEWIPTKDNREKGIRRKI